MKSIVFRNCIAKSMLVSVLLLVFAGNSIAQPPLPEIKKEDGKHTFYVDGKPFLMFGCQVWNSSAWPPVMEKFYEQAEELGCNTLEVPIYWQNIEPKPGEYNFEKLDKLIRSAREHGFRLVLLWFGSYKNGRSQYAPPWVLEHPEKYPRMQNAAGEDIYVLSAISEANRQADQRAFVEVMKRIREIDRQHKTVIMMQVENEPGSMWTDREYSQRANELFHGQVPSKLTEKLGKEPGTWEEVFGIEAAEAFQSYYISKYIDAIAVAGREVYNLPMYANVWIRENGFRRPGEYPSGGPTSNMLDLWKANAPNLDLLALDVYHGNVGIFNELADNYDRADNPLFIPEMGKGHNFARFQFYAFGNYDAIGVAPYGADPFHRAPVDKRNKEHLDAKFESIAKNYDLLSGAVHPITELQGTGRLRAVGQEEGLSEKLVRLENYDLLISFGYPSWKDQSEQTGRVLIGQLGPNEFLLAGFDAKFEFRPKYGSGYNNAEYVLVEQGHYEGEQWVRERIWNGDALYYSTLPHDGAILRIKLRRVQSSRDFQEKANFEN